MLFNSLKYALFLPIVVALFWASPQRFRLPILLVASYIFYAAWRPGYVLLIFGLTLANYFLGLRIAACTHGGMIPSNSSDGPSSAEPGCHHDRSARHHPEEIHKKAWLIAAIALNLLTLAFFKYIYFLDNSLAALLQPFSITFPKVPLEIILPLGISFFVFEFIHYIVDVYHGGKPVKSFLSFALFAGFFPTQIAGPIKRYQNFIPQFEAAAKISVKHFDEGIYLILAGLVKKILFADNLSLFVQGGFSHPELFSGADLWLFTYAFAFQIYFDFSGYTDIARGSAMLFGYNVPLNFNLPYIASSIADFWHRWHISLSTWLRDYLFIPLGGSRCSKAQLYRNLFITMALGGLWHGAALHFVLWGMYHGILLIAHRMFRSATDSVTLIRSLLDSTAGTIISRLFTFHCVCIGWVLFRAGDMQSAGSILGKMLLPTGSFAHLALPSINYPLIYPTIYLLLPTLALGHILMNWSKTRSLGLRAPFMVKAAYCSCLLALIIVFSPDKSPRFIYFQF